MILDFNIRDGLSDFISLVFEYLFVELPSESGESTIVGVIYSPSSAPRADIEIFTTVLLHRMDQIDNDRTYGIIIGDMNIDLLKFGIHDGTDTYLDNNCSRSCVPLIFKTI